MKGYCLMCKKKVDIKDEKEKKTKNGRLMMSGKCPKCGGKVNVFIKNKK